MTTEPTAAELELLMIPRHRTQVDLVLVEGEDLRRTWTFAALVEHDGLARSFAVFPVDGIYQATVLERSQGNGITGLHFVVDKIGIQFVPVDPATASDIIDVLHRMFIGDPTLEQKDRWVFVTPEDWVVDDIRDNQPTESAAKGNGDD